MNDTENADTVTLSRSEYDALLDRIADSEDRTAIDRLEARVAKEGFEAAGQRGRTIGIA